MASPMSKTATPSASATGSGSSPTTPASSPTSTTGSTGSVPAEWKRSSAPPPAAESSSPEGAYRLPHGDRRERRQRATPDLQSSRPRDIGPTGFDTGLRDPPVSRVQAAADRRSTNGSWRRCADGCPGRASHFASTALRQSPLFENLDQGQPILLRDFDLAEVAVLLVVRPRGEIESVGRAGAGAVAEANAPQPVDDEVSVVAAQAATVTPFAFLVFAVGVDPAIAEVADEQTAPESAEVRRRHCDAPRGVQLTMRGHRRDEIAVGIEFAHETVTLSRDVIHPRFQRVGDENRVADGLDAERAIPRWDRVVLEFAGGVKFGEGPVE